MEVSSKRLIDSAFADRCVRAWGVSNMTRSLSIVTSTSCCCPHLYAGWGHSDRALFWWLCSRGWIDWSQLSDITACTMWHLCEQVCKLIRFSAPYSTHSLCYKWWKKINGLGPDGLQVALHLRKNRLIYQGIQLHLMRCRIIFSALWSHLQSYNLILVDFLVETVVVNKIAYFVRPYHKCRRAVMAAFFPCPSHNRL